jgi:hypothetical protein
VETALFTSSNTRFWLSWLRVATIGVIAFGLFLVVAPVLARQGFSLLVYSSSGHITGFDKEASDYIELTHAVMGAVMVGWGTALLLVLRGPMRRNLREGVQIYAVSLTCWFVPDTIFSLASGFWQNAILNVMFAAPFAVPLVTLWRQSRMVT